MTVRRGPRSGARRCETAAEAGCLLLAAVLAAAALFWGLM